jgi:hypothetical protein
MEQPGGPPLSLHFGLLGGLSPASPLRPPLPIHKRPAVNLGVTLVDSACLQPPCVPVSPGSIAPHDQQPRALPLYPPTASHTGPVTHLIQPRHQRHHHTNTPSNTRKKHRAASISTPPSLPSPLAARAPRARHPRCRPPRPPTPHQRHTHEARYSQHLTFEITHTPFL